MIMRVALKRAVVMKGQSEPCQKEEWHFFLFAVDLTVGEGAFSLFSTPS